MRGTRVAFFIAVVLSAAASPCNASWLSDVTGVNIDLRNAVNPVVAPPHVVPIEPPNPASIPVGSDDKRALLTQISEFRSGSARIASIYSTTSTIIVLGSILFGLGASVAAFFKASNIAGTLSILGAAILGVGNALPINQNADFYQLLSAQSLALLSDAQLRPQMSIGDFDAFRGKLTTLILYEGQNFPSRGNTQQATQDLVTKMAALSPENHVTGR
jgi:hypothetical protein